MTEAVYKYEIYASDYISIPMPKHADVLCVQVQNGSPQIWARVSLLEDLEQRVFRVAGTGHQLGDDVGRYVGTFQLECGSLVFHVFEVVR